MKLVFAIIFAETFGIDVDVEWPLANLYTVSIASKCSVYFSISMDTIWLLYCH